jgi:hypothetical protein
MRSAAVRQPSSASFWLNQAAAHVVGLGLGGGARAQRLGQDRVAAHLRVVAHAVAGHVGGKAVPVAALA